MWAFKSQHLYSSYVNGSLMMNVCHTLCAMKDHPRRLLPSAELSAEFHRDKSRRWGEARRAKGLWAPSGFLDHQKRTCFSFTSGKAACDQLGEPDVGDTRWATEGQNSTGDLDIIVLSPPTVGGDGIGCTASRPCEADSEAVSGTPGPSLS